jgi:hypothetical protein
VRVINALGNTDGTVRDAEALRAAYPRFTHKERQAAINAVANIGDRASVVWLTERVKDPAENLTLRRSAAQRASRAGLKAAELSAMYDAVIERTLKEGIIDALAEDGSRAALYKLMPLAQRTSRDPLVRRRAIAMLSDSGDPRAMGLLDLIVGR